MFTPRILIADDDRALIDAIRMELNAAGYNVTSCRDGSEAIEKARAIPHDVIVLDVQMPGDSGPEAQALLTDLRDINDTPVIYITGDTSEQTRVLCNKAGTYRIIYKPFDIDELVDAIGEAIQSNQRAA